MSDVERIKAGVVLRLHAMQPNDREAVIFTLRRAILDCIIQRNATIAGRKYNPEHYDEFDLCEAQEHARAAIAAMETGRHE